jgi:hypothetical protein
MVYVKGFLTHPLRKPASALLDIQLKVSEQAHFKPDFLICFHRLNHIFTST